MAKLTQAEFKAMLARSIAKAKAQQDTAAIAGGNALVQKIKEQQPVTVDVSKLGISTAMLKTQEGKEQAVEIIQEIMSDVTAQRQVSGDVKPDIHSDTVDGISDERVTDYQIQAWLDDGGNSGEYLSKSSDRVSATKQLGVTRSVTLNVKQQEFNDRVMKGESCVLIGAAGTGKTTCMRTVTRNLIDSNTLPKLQTGTKHLSMGSYGAVILSFTRKAVNNIRHAVVQELKANTLTAHKLLEFQPIFYEIEDPSKAGSFKTTMRFEPTRTKHNPLPAELKFVGWEESSMVSVELHNLVEAAMPHKHQTVFLGDIQQLPPTFGVAILGFKMLELPVVELTEVYRQAKDSPIIDLAWKILEGNPHVFSSKAEKYDHVTPAGTVKRIRIPALEALSRTVTLADGTTSTVKFQPWQKSLSPDLALLTATRQFNQWIVDGYYNPDEDMILVPFNVNVGTVELNKGIQNFLGRQRGAIVTEIIAGFNKHYLAVGDRVLYDKEDAFIVSIERNGQYLGKSPLAPSRNLDRWGHYQEEITAGEKADAAAKSEMSEEDVDKLLTLTAGDEEDRVQAASHIVTIRYAYGDETASLETAGEINNLLGGNAITVHKAQGSEWPRVFILLHNSHATMCSRELLYTGVTRARSFLHIICEPTSFEKGVRSQRIKGNTWQEKAELFKGKQEDGVIPVKSSGLLGTTTVSGQVAIKLEDIVPQAIKERARDAVAKYWALAVKRIGKDIGEVPTLDFNLRNCRAVGMAYPWQGRIQLNPIWLAVDDPKVVDDVLYHTVIHELCHVACWRTDKNARPHGKRWKMFMRMMGVPDSRIHPAPLPPYWSSKDQLLKSVFAKYKELQNELQDEEIASEGKETEEDEAETSSNEGSKSSQLDQTPGSSKETADVRKQVSTVTNPTVLAALAKLKGKK